MRKVSKRTYIIITLFLTVGLSSSALADSSNLYFGTFAGTAGTVVNSIDGVGSAAQFYSPRGLTVDAYGNLFVADSSNNTIRKVTAAGEVTTFAGTAGSRGIADGIGSAARFVEPFSVAYDGHGSLFVADTSNNAIRKISSSGVVTTFAGGSTGSSDGIGTAAKFHEPRGIAVDASGNVYVADYRNSVIRKITSSGVVTTLAGTAGVQGSTDGAGSVTRFKDPMGVAVDTSGNVYVADTANRTIRKISAEGIVTTIAGSATSGGISDGTGTAARFTEPRALAVDGNGTLYVTDYNAHTVRKINSAGVITTLAGTANTAGITDGKGSAAQFYNPSGITVDSVGNIFVTDTFNSTIRKITSTAEVSTFAGLAGRSSSVDGTGSAARFEDPYSVAVDGLGNTYIADATDNSIRKISADRVVTTLAGLPGSFGSSDGAGSTARFNGPLGIAADRSGTVFVSDTGNQTIRKITSDGLVTTLAGTAGAGGSNDGIGMNARFSGPNGIAVDLNGNLYVADTSNNTIRKITQKGEVTTLAGLAGATGLLNGIGNAARFSVPFDVATDSAGNVFVCDHGNHVIRKITTEGVVTTLAGSGSPGGMDGIGSAATFKFPSGIAIDSAGYIYVADTDNQLLRMISSNGTVTTIAGSSIGSANGVGSAARFFNPKDVSIDSVGTVYIADRGNHTVRKGSPLSALNVSSDCLFDWAEQTYPQYFSPSNPVSALVSPYYYRYYANSAAYLATSSAGNHLWYLGPVTGNVVTDLGPISGFLPVAGCQ